MRYLILGFLFLYPWAPFLFQRIYPGLNIWQQQQQFVQIGIIILFSCSFVFKPNIVKVKNLPLAILVGYVGLRTFENWWVAAMMKGIPFPSLYFLNFLYLIIFYKLCVQYLNKKSITLILKWLSYSVLGIVFLCILEKFGLSQFIKELPGVYHPKTKMFVTGVLGNPTLLSAYLGMCLPLFFGRKFFNIFSVILIWIILLFWTGQTSEVSTTGIAVGLAVSGYYLYHTNKKVFYILLGCFLASLIFFYGKIDKTLFSLTGRMVVWEKYFELSKDTFLFGKGLGSVEILSVILGKFGEYRWDHLHNEFLEFGFKLGLVGLIAILYAIVKHFKVKLKFDKDVLVLKTLFVGFLVSCLSVYSAHLWAFTPLVMFSYVSIYCIRNGEIKTRS